MTTSTTQHQDQDTQPVAPLTPMAMGFTDSPPPPDTRTLVEQVQQGAVEPPAGFNLYPSHTLPMDTARRLIRDIFTITGTRTLVWWRGDWWRYQGTCWARAESELDIKGPIWYRLEGVEYSSKDDEVKPWSPTQSRVANLIEPLQILTHLPDSQHAPCWLNDAPRRAGLIPMTNGLLDLNTLVMEPHTPSYFATWALDFPYLPGAKCPVWEQFLAQVFAHDMAGAQLLQEYAGYLISGRLDQHKALLIVGPRRGGKGTISRVLHQLMGRGNTVSPSLGNLGSEFGLSPLIGKPLAVIEDARGDDDRRNNTTVERLLSVIGCDQVAINRKNKDYLTTTLPTRFVLVSNETPRFLDSSGAITSRFMSVKLRQSFEANPDTALGDKLGRELPGIFNWALQGLTRLNQQGAFTRPETMDTMHALMGDISSPVARFIDERYTVTGDEADVLTVSTVFNVFRAWNDEQGYRPMNRDSFVQRVQASCPQVIYKNSRLNGVAARRFFGIQAKPYNFS